MLVASNKYPINFITFNQDGTNIAITTRQGFVIVIDAINGKQYIKTSCEGSKIVSLLYNSSMIAISSDGERNNIRFSQNSVQIIDVKVGMSIAEFNINNPILNVYFSRSMLFVATKNNIHVYHTGQLKQLDLIETCSNVQGLLCGHEDENILILTQGKKPGDVALLRYVHNRLQDTYVINCHKTLVQCAAVSMDGQYFATASVKGTIIRVYSVKDKQIIKELRRGKTECTINSIAFNSGNTRLACTSAHGTLHVFALKDEYDGDVAKNKKSALHIFKKFNSSLESEYSFAQFTVNCDKSVCKFVGSRQLLVSCANGILYKLAISGNGITEEERFNVLQNN